MTSGLEIEAHLEKACVELYVVTLAIQNISLNYAKRLLPQEQKPWSAVSVLTFFFDFNFEFEARPRVIVENKRHT